MIEHNTFWRHFYLKKKNKQGKQQTTKRFHFRNLSLT